VTDVGTAADTIARVLATVSGDSPA
jgi:hypothetical protein